MWMMLLLYDCFKRVARFRFVVVIFHHKIKVSCIAVLKYLLQHVTRIKCDLTQHEQKHHLQQHMWAAIEVTCSIASD